MKARFLIALAAVSAAPRAGALSIVFNDVGTNPMSQAALDGFQTAANQWQALIANDVTVRIDIACYDFGPGQSNTIGQAGSYFYSGTYAEIHGAWAATPTKSIWLAAMPSARL